MNPVRLLLCLSLLLTGCGTEYIVKREQVPELPPAELLIPCVPPILPIETYGDPVAAIDPLLDALEECDDRITELNNWRARRFRDPVFEDP